MKNISTFLLLFIAITLSSAKLSEAATGTASISLRPSHVNIKTDTSQGAVLVTLSGYSTKDIRYRLFNGSSQYACWDNLTNTYISSASYSLGPQAAGNPTNVSSFWIIYQRGANISVSASYRDRIGPGYSTNNNTVLLPNAEVINDSFIISGKLVGSEVNNLSQKHVVLAWSGSTLVSVTSSYLNSGNFELYLPAGITIDKIEVRTLYNLPIAEIAGTWVSFGNIPDIQLIDKPLQDSKLKNITIEGADLEGFNPYTTSYNILLQGGITTIPHVEVETGNQAASAVVIPAIDLSGDEEARTSTIIVTAADGTTTSTYKIVFSLSLPGSNALLLYLFVNGSAVDGFIPGTFNYKVPVLCGTNTVPVINYTASDTNATITVTDASDLNGTEAERTTMIVVTSEDGITTSTYKVVFDIYIPATNSSLIDFSVNGTTISDFDPSVFEYEVVLPSGTIAIPTVTIVTSDEKATTVITNARHLTGTEEECTTKVLVTAEDGSTTSRYQVLFSVYVPATNATLSGVSINDSSLVNFSPGTFLYDILLPSGTSAIPFVSYTLADEKATAVITNAINLFGTEAERTTSVLVTAEDGKTTQIYKVIFSVYITGTDAFLSDLSLNGTTVSGFSPASYSYSILLPFGTTVNPGLTFATNDSKATTTVSNASNLNGTEEERTAKVIVRAEDGITTLIYKVIFTVYVPGSDAFLSDLSINCSTIKGFNRDTFEYIVVLPYGTTKFPPLSYRLADVNAIAVVSNASNINGNAEERTTTIHVTAEDGVTKARYLVLFITDDNSGIVNPSHSGISIYPVPALDQLTIRGLSSVSRLDILDIKGRVLRNVVFTGEEVTIDISDLEDGMYFLRTESETVKFIKE